MPTNTPDAPTQRVSIETENPQSMPAHLRPGAERLTTPKGGRRDGAGAIPLPPEQKMIAEKISLRPADWEYLQLFIPADVDEKQRTPGHLVRAALEHLRLSTPNGPSQPFYRRDPSQPRPVSTTPAVALTARKRGITKAEQINEEHAFWVKHHPDAGKKTDR